MRTPEMMLGVLSLTCAAVAWADDDADGIVKFTGDSYRKDVRLASALAGQPVNLDIPPEPVEAQVAGARQGRPRPPRDEGGFDFFSGLFGN